MRIRVSLAACLLMLAPLYGGQSPEEAKSESKWVITGTVVDQSGEPVEGATISDPLREEISPTKSAKDGTFEIPVPAKWVNRLGGRVYLDLNVKKEQLFAHKGISGKIGELKPVEIVLKPGHEVTVRVTDSGGKPVADAEVAALISLNQFATGRTDANGRWSCLLPPDPGRWSIYARKSEVGFNYKTSRYGARTDLKVKPLPDEVSLSLNGARSLRVKMVDPKGQPLAGIGIVPWTIQTKGNEHDINLSGSKTLVVPTNADGVAVLDWLPVDFVQGLGILHRSDDYAAFDHAHSLRQESPVDEMTITLYPKETLSGRVTHADGRPADGIRVSATGEGVGMNKGRGNAVTDSEGRYEMRVDSEQAYIVRVADDEWGAAYKAPIVVRAGKPVTDIDFSLVPATKLHGRVAAGVRNTPMKDTRVSLYIEAGRIPEELLELAPEDDTFWHGLLDVQSTQTDENGRFEFTIGPGTYDLRNPGGSNRGESIAILVPKDDPPKEIEKNFHFKRKLKGPLTVQVVDQDGNPVPHATLLARYRASSGRGWYQPVETDEKGVYETERELEKLVIHGASPDGKLKGITRLDATAADGKVVVGPTTIATGILLDKDGEIVPKKELQYGIKIYSSPDESGPFSWSFGGKVTTDAKGCFTIEGLIPQESYEIYFAIDSILRTVTIAKAPTIKPLNLGKLKVDTQPSTPYVPPTPAERTASAFEQSADAPLKKRLKKTLGGARRMYTRPLVLLGQADDPACIELFRLFYGDSTATGEGKSVKDLRWEFELVALPAEKKAVAKYAKKQGISTGEDAPAMLLALDEQGEVVARFPLEFQREPVAALRPGVDESDKETTSETPAHQTALLQFLLEHKLPTRDAEVMLSEALAEATAQDKKVFLICSASWCGPCRMLARFLDPFHEKLNSHYIFVKLDTSRDTHAREINKRYKGERSGGVHWYVILDAEGEELISSNMPADGDDNGDKDAEYPTNGDNMGHPSSAEGAAHFMKMLSSTAPGIDSELLEEMREALEED